MSVPGPFTPRCLGLLLVIPALGLSPPTPPATSGPRVADFHLVIEHFRAGKDRIGKIDVVYRDGAFYQLYSESPGEVVVVEPGARTRVTLIDLRERVQCQVLGVELEVHLDDLRKRLNNAIQKREKSAARGDRVSAEMTRDLVDPKFTERFDPDSGTLHLENVVLSIDAVGEADPDPARLVLIRSYLGILARFSSMRVPEDLPPFGMLETIDRLTGRHRLRPREISILVRVAGPPQRFRWTHQLIPSLTDRDREAIRRIDGLRASATLIPYRAYEGRN